MKTLSRMLLLAAVMLGATLVNAAEMPKPRAIDDKDRSALAASLKRFGVASDEKTEMQAAGAFRFAGGTSFLYAERSDLGSVLFERASYGTNLTPLDEKAYARENLLPLLAKTLRRVAPTSEAPVFAQFQDEFAGAVPVRTGLKLDPRQVAVLVARTAAYTREIDSVPVFGSELIAGLDRDGTIGRLRVHWPAIDPKLVVEAQQLQRVVMSGDWRPPQELLTGETTILETTAGVGHSAFADPGFRSAAVVRVLARRETKGLEYPISTTAYHYFDASGKEIQFSAFPADPGSDPKEKGEK